MGYTHYWNSVDFTPEEWEGVMADVVKILDHASLRDLVCQEWDQADHAPLVNRDLIRFNGKGDDGHETFLYHREGTQWCFCKTNRKPYDAAVCAVLLVLNHHCEVLGKDLDLKSDGKHLDWELGQKYAQEATGYNIQIP